MPDSDLSYTFTCPNCSGNFSILLEKIPPVQARFRCPHCKQPMDFPSREEARVYARLQGKAPGAAAPGPERSTAREQPSGSPDDTFAAGTGPSTRFRVEKPGYEMDVFDRRAVRNLIRSGAITENDRIRVDEREPVLAGSLTYLKSLFHLRKQARGVPPPVCRSHTDKIAFYQCRENGRPLCEDCAPEKKFGGTTIRVCGHCGSTAAELVHA